MRTSLNVVCAVAAALQLAGVATAHAAGTAAVPGDDLASAIFSTDDLGATVIKGVLCGIPGGIDTNPPPAALATNAILTTQSHLVITPSGNAALICHAKIPVGPPQAIVINGDFCAIPGTPGTNQSHLVISPSGNVLLTCHLNGSS
jgi:hypothetical protein